MATLTEAAAPTLTYEAYMAEPQSVSDIFAD